MCLNTCSSLTVSSNGKVLFSDQQFHYQVIISEKFVSISKKQNWVFIRNQNHKISKHYYYQFFCPFHRAYFTLFTRSTNLTFVNLKPPIVVYPIVFKTFVNVGVKVNDPEVMLKKQKKPDKTLYICHDIHLVSPLNISLESHNILISLELAYVLMFNVSEVTSRKGKRYDKISNISPDIYIARHLVNSELYYILTSIIIPYGHNYSKAISKQFIGMRSLEKTGAFGTSEIRIEILCVRSGITINHKSMRSGSILKSRAKHQSMCYILLWLYII
jgi:hypothetical protein